MKTKIGSIFIGIMLSAMIMTANAGAAPKWSSFQGGSSNTSANTSTHASNPAPAPHYTVSNNANNFTRSTSYTRTSTPTTYSHPSNPGGYTRPSTPNNYIRPAVPTSYTHPTVPTGYTQTAVPTRYTHTTIPGDIRRHSIPGNDTRQNIPVTTNNSPIPNHFPQRDIPGNYPNKSVPTSYPHTGIPISSSHKDIPYEIHRKDVGWTIAAVAALSILYNTPAPQTVIVEATPVVVDTEPVVIVQQAAPAMDPTNIQLSNFKGSWWGGLPESSKLKFVAAYIQAHAGNDLTLFMGKSYEDFVESLNVFYQDTYNQVLTIDKAMDIVTLKLNGYYEYADCMTQYYIMANYSTQYTPEAVNAKYDECSNLPQPTPTAQPATTADD